MFTQNNYSPQVTDGWKDDPFRCRWSEPLERFHRKFYRITLS